MGDAPAPQKAVKKDAGTPDGPDLLAPEPSYGPGHKPAVHALLSLQRIGGNQAALRALGLPGAGGAHGRVPSPGSGQPSLTAAPANVQRLISATDFYNATYIGKMTSRGDVLKEMDEWLREYEKQGLNKPPTTESQKQQAISTLEEISEASDRLVATHPDLSSSKNTKRYSPIKNLGFEARKEIERLRTIDFSPNEKAQAEQSGNKTVVKQEIEGDCKSSLEKVGKLIDLAVPKPDTDATLEFELKIPIPPMGFMGLHLTCEAERDDESVKVRTELGVTGGVGIPDLVEIKAELGGYLQAVGAHSAEAMQLISYSLYRRVVESRWIPREVGRLMWGGSTSTRAHKMAEKWAANVEKDVLLKDESGKKYVETGMYGAVSAEGGVNGIAQLGGKVKASTGKRYSRKSIERLKLAGKDPSNMSATEIKKALEAPLPTYRGQTQKSAGFAMRRLSGKFEFDASVIKGEAELMSEWAQRKSGAKGLEYELAGTEFSAMGQFNLPLGTGRGIVTALHLTEMSASIADRLESVEQEGENELSEGQKGAQRVNTVDDLATWIGSTAKGAVSPDELDMSLKVPDEVTGTEVSGSISLRATISAEKQPEEPGELEFALSIVKTRGIESSIVKAEFEQGKKIWSKSRPFGKGATLPEQALTEDTQEEQGEENVKEDEGEEQGRPSSG
jgi:hypothetical protein